RAFTHISDVVPLIADSVTVPAARNQVFNVGADVPSTVNELAQRVAEAMGVECRGKHLEPRDEGKLAFSDHSKALRIFAHCRHSELKDGIDRMAAWVKSQGARSSSVFQGIEIARKLPPSWAAATVSRAVE